MTPPTYKPLGLAQVCEIRDFVENPPADWLPDTNIVGIAVTTWSTAGFDPRDVRQAAEEALTNLRQK